jgi:hypothetical protein
MAARGVLKINKMIKQTCYNCKFAGQPFKVGDLTHVHCQNKELYPPEKRSEKTTYETLMEWYNKCEKHEFKPEILEP